MNSKEKVAKIIDLLRTEKDEVLKMLKVSELIKDSNISELIDIYNKVKNREIDIVEIKSSIELSAEQKKTLEKKLLKQFPKDLIFSYQIDKDIVGGLQIKINDTMINLNTNVLDIDKI